VYTEHVSYFHIVDTRNFENQTIKVSNNDDKNISGIGFTCDGSSILVGLEEQIQQYNVDLFKRKTFDEFTFN
jgi:hypothetical protein